MEPIVFISVAIEFPHSCLKWVIGIYTNLKQVAQAR